MSKNLNTRVIDLTIGELIDFLVGSMSPEKQPPKPVLPNGWQEEDIVHGIAAIAKLFGVSKTTIHEYRKQGWIEPAIRQPGHNVICNVPLALELSKKRK